MGVKGKRGAARPPSQPARTRARAPPRTLDTESAAWLLAIPCALATVAAIYLLASPVGHIVHPDQYPYTAFNYERTLFRPEASEQGGYLIALGAPMLLALVLLTTRHRLQQLSESIVRAGLLFAGAAILAGIAASLVGQYSVKYGETLILNDNNIFKPATLVVAGIVAFSAYAAARNSTIVDRLSNADRARWVPVAVGGMVVLATAIWLTQAVNSDKSIAWAHPLVWYNVQYPLDETFAVVNGRTPLVDFTTQYGSLWPFIFAIPLVTIEKSLLVFTLTACLVTALSLMAVFGVLRRATGNRVAALLLYLPFLATSLFIIDPPAADRSSPASYFASFPLRSAGPLLLAWLTARRIGGAKHNAAWLYLAAGFVTINNLEFGLSALGATTAALIWTSDSLDRARLLRFAGAAASGIAGAIAVVCTLTLVRAGSLPSVERMLDYPRLFSSGYHMAPFPRILGFHLVCYATYVAAIAVATVRAIDREPNRVLTGMLVWGGIFGLGASSYFVGQSGPLQLKTTFAAWALTTMLLTVVAMRRLAADPPGWATPSRLVVLFGAGLCVCSLAQVPNPWTQLHRLSERPTLGLEVLSPDPYVPTARTRDFIASSAYGPKQFFIKRGAPAVILVTTGHRIADSYGIVNVSRYTGMFSIHTQDHLRKVVDDLREAGGNTIILPTVDGEIYQLLDRWGFAVVTRSGLQRIASAEHIVTETLPEGDRVTKWVDLRNLRPAFLRHGRGTPVRAG